MKNIKDLGLELIELEDRVLLVESKVGGGKLNDWVKLYIPKIERVEYWNENLVGFCNKIVSSTKPLEGLPLLVIEDEVEKLALIACENKFSTRIAADYWKEGYNKAKETYKFTEEDLVRVFNVGTNASFEGHNKNLSKDELMDFYSKKLHNLNQSLIKKELWVDVIDIGRTHYIKDDNNGFNDVTGINFHKYEWELKISEGKIKAVWK